MGRLTENECMDLFAESLQDDKRKLQAEIARLAAEVVQLRHRLAERADAHDRDGKALVRLGAENDELRAEYQRLGVKYGATHDCKERAWAEAERLRAERDGLRERAERAERAVKEMVDAFTCDVADWRRSHEAVENARAILDAASSGEGKGEL
jgi:chromosome segregation ATPase